MTSIWVGHATVTRFAAVLSHAYRFNGWRQAGLVTVHLMNRQHGYRHHLHVHTQWNPALLSPLKPGAHGKQEIGYDVLGRSDSTN